MILPLEAIVAIVDGENLRLLKNKAAEPHIDLEELDVPPLHSSNAGSGLRHHDEAANPDADRKREDAHTSAAAHQLNLLGTNIGIKDVLIVADPRTLGELRKHFHPTLKKKVIGELSKDLVARSSDEISEYIRNA
jgi:protein required for attachment to host cells